jgi:hypothetical protein
MNKKISDKKISGFEKDVGIFLGVGVTLGVTAGIFLGSVFGNIGVGISFGIVFGVCCGFMVAIIKNHEELAKKARANAKK